MGHVPKDGEDEDTGQQARAGVDETRYDGISEMYNSSVNLGALNDMLPSF